MTIRSIAVVGAGPAGLVAAQRLSSAGHDVVVLEKSRGVGGRTSTRRSDTEARFDHGCQFVSRIDASPRDEISSWIDGGFVDRWSPRLAPGTTTPEFAGEHWSIGVPAMNSMMKHLAEGLDVRTGWRVESIDRIDAGWRLRRADSEDVVEVRQVIVAVPAVQAIELMKSTGFRHLERLQDVDFDPVWSILIEGDGVPTLPFDAYGSSTEPVKWLVSQSSRPGRCPQAAWVALASSTWSREHLEDDSESVRDALMDSVSNLTGQRWTASGAVHRWRHGIVASPLGEPSLVDRSRGLIACGDWCLGPTIEHAIVSAESAVEHAIGMSIG
jgi:hypothetical protein